MAIASNLGGVGRRDDRSVRAFNINIKDESRKWDGHKEAVLC